MLHTQQSLIFHLHTNLLTRNNYNNYYLYLNQNHAVSFPSMYIVNLSAQETYAFF